MERNIGTGIEALITSRHRPLPAELWLSVLVPFAAQVFVRGADWIPRFGKRFDWIEGDQDLRTHAQSADNANMARLMELQRLQPAMMAARWQVLHCPPNVGLIVNDLGRVGMVHSAGMQGYTIPLTRRAALVLLRAEQGCHVIWDERAGTWFADGVEHCDLTPTDVEEMNAALRGSSVVECFGPDPELVRLQPSQPPRDPAEDPLFEPHLIVPSPAWLRAREMDWARMMTLVSQPPQRPEDDQPWTVMADVMPEEDDARGKLQELFLGEGAKWFPGVPGGEGSFLRQIVTRARQELRKLAGRSGHPRE